MEHLHPSVVSAILAFASTFIWQVLIIGLVIYYRRPIFDLFKKLERIKVGDNEAHFHQEASSEATKVTGAAEEKIRVLSAGGFFTREGIVDIVQSSGLLTSGERVNDSLKLFSTNRQHTWLLTTSKNLFCVLDDEHTQSTRNLIQWKLPLADANPVSVRAHKRTVGLVSIGPKKNWLYSIRLHPDEDKLKRDIEAMISSAAKG